MGLKKKSKAKSEESKSEVKKYPAASAVMHSIDADGKVDWKDKQVLGALWARNSPNGTIELQGKIDEDSYLVISLDGGRSTRKSKDEAEAESEVEAEELPEIED